MRKYLRLTFSDDNGAKRTIRIKDPKDGLTSSDIQNFVNQIVGLNILLTKNGVAVTKGLSGVITDSDTIWEAQ